MFLEIYKQVNIGVRGKAAMDSGWACAREVNDNRDTWIT